MQVRVWLTVLLAAAVVAQACGCCSEAEDELIRDTRASQRSRPRSDRAGRRRRGRRRGFARIPIERYRQIQQLDLGWLLGNVSGTAAHPAFTSFIAESNTTTPMATGLLGAARPATHAAEPSGLQMDLKEVDMERRNIIKDAGCKPRKMPVQVPESDDPLVLYTPSCVMVPRCSGCCGHELLECVPTEVKNIRKKVLALRLSEGDTLALTDEESSIKKIKMQKHVKCECQCKVKESDCRTHQVYDAANCRCVCPNEDEAFYCQGTKVWSEKDCMCKCPKILECSTGLEFNEVQCRCLPSRPSGPLLFAVPSSPGTVGPGGAASSSVSGGAQSSGWGSAMSSGVTADRPPPNRQRPAQPRRTEPSVSQPRRTEPPVSQPRWTESPVSQYRPTSPPATRYQTASPYNDWRSGQSSSSASAYDDWRQPSRPLNPYSERRYGQSRSSSSPYGDRRYQERGSLSAYGNEQRRHWNVNSGEYNRGR